MKYIVNTTDETLLIGGITISPKESMPVINKEMLSRPEIKSLLDQGKIRIDDTGEELSSPEKQS